MARKAGTWIKSERVGGITLFLSRRSPYWQMYWIEGECVTKSGRRRPKERHKSTRETDLAFARIMAGRKNEKLYTLREFPDEKQPTPPARHPVRELASEFIAYLEGLGRSFGHVRTINGQLQVLCDWMEVSGMEFVEDVNPDMLQVFTEHLLGNRKVTPSTANAYVDAIHNFFGYVIFKRKIMVGQNPAATGRQAALDKRPARRSRVPVISPTQINAIIRVARERKDWQIANMVAFVCEGGFRFQELQFLQVGDLDLERREIILAEKWPNLHSVRPELQRQCLTADGAWRPKTSASQRPIHITDRMLKVIESMGLGDPEDWVFANSAGSQVAENKTLRRLKACALSGGVLIESNPRSGKPWSKIKWHWLRHFHRTRAHVSGIRREVSKLAMGHAGDSIHDHYRGVDVGAFHAEYGKFDSGIDDSLLVAV